MLLVTRWPPHRDRLEAEQQQGRAVAHHGCRPSCRTCRPARPGHDPQQFVARLVPQRQDNRFRQPAAESANRIRNRTMIKVRPFNWRRFSLRTLFVLTTLVCLAAGMWSAIVNPYRVQLQSLAAVNRLHGTAVKEAFDRPAWHRWLVTSFLGKEAYFHVTFADLAGCQV